MERRLGGPLLFLCLTVQKGIAACASDMLIYILIGANFVDSYKLIFGNHC